VDSYHPDEGRTPDEGEESNPELPRRGGGPSRAAHTEARAELRDRETYYTELRLAVYGQSQSVPRPRAALDDQGADTRNPGEDDMTARFDDTWT
jgi:hypothetical protein